MQIAITNNDLVPFSKKGQRKGIKLSLLFCLLVSSMVTEAQFIVVPDSIYATTHQPEAKSYYAQQTDITDVFTTVFKNKQPKARLDTMAELQPFKLHWSTVPAIGYTLQTGFAALLSENVAFYTSLLPNQKISSISTSLTYSQYNQIIFPLQADIWTKKNKYNFILDWRYMDYPSTTFGLGGHTLTTEGYTIDFNYLKFHQSVLRRVTKNFYAGAGYFLDYFWNVREINPTQTETDFERYGLTKKSVSSGIAARLIYDSRLNQINPVQGFYANVSFRPNFKFLGSDNNWNSLVVEFRKYIKFRPTSKNVLALWSYNWLTVGGGKPPYLLLPSTGWDDFFNTGRGYIQSRFRGRDMLYLESEYRFGITNNGLLGGVVFANAESFSRTINGGFSSIDPGVGAGIRIKLNKFSGANLCIDYGFGIQGSKGISVNLGEVF